MICKNIFLEIDTVGSNSVLGTVANWCLSNKELIDAEEEIRLVIVMRKIMPGTSFNDVLSLSKSINNPKIKFSLIFEPTRLLEIIKRSDFYYTS